MATPILTAYYPSWKIYKGCKPSGLRLDLLDHVCYAFARINDDGTIRSLDVKADFQLPVDGASGCIAAMTKLRRERYPKLRVLVSIGGGSGSAPFPSVASTDAKLHAFCQSALALLQAHDLDGVDIDWEHPANPHQGELFVKLIRTLRSYLPRPRYTLTAALPAGEWCLRNIDLPAILAHSGTPTSHLDYLHVMAYDFAGPWTGLSGHHAQLHAPPDPPNAFGKRSIASTVRYLVSERGIDPSKIIVGIPAYGRSFNGVGGPGEKFNGHSGDIDGIYDYRNLPRPGTEEIYDESRGAAWCLGPDGGWVSYDCPDSVRQKCQFVKEHRLGGIFFWTGSSDADDENRSLVVAGYKALKY